MSDASAPGEHFDPQHLTTDASINRLVIAASPHVPARLAGHEAFTILSAEAVARVATSHGVAVAPDAIADDLDAAIRQGDRRERRAAGAVVAEVGLRLACLLATLRLPATAAAQGWSSWRRAYLRHWANVGEVQLAGGLLAGAFGPAVVDETNAVLARLGVRTRAALVPWPAWAVLIGAARRLPLVAGVAVGMDLGGSRVKAAVVRARPEGAVELTRLATTPVPFDQMAQPPAESLAAFLARILEHTAGDVRRLGVRPRGVAVAIACYLGQGRQCADRGVYANLPDLGNDAWRRRLDDLFSPSVKLGVFHDGTAAAASMPGAGGQADATLVLGTAIGVGFPPAGLPRWRTLTVLPG